MNAPLVIKEPTRKADFSDIQQRNPTAPLPGDLVDIEFDELRSSVDTIAKVLKRLTSSDGLALAQVVGRDQLQDDVLTELTAAAELAVRSDADAARAAAHAATDAMRAVTEMVARVAAALQRITDIDQHLHSVHGGLSDQLTAIAQPVLLAEANALVVAELTDNVANEVAGEVEEATKLAELCQAWAEHLPDTIPPDVLDVMGVTGDHWSSRWWANQASQIVSSVVDDADRAETAADEAEAAAGVAEDAADAAEAAWDQFNDLYLGKFATAPVKDNDGNDLQTGALYFDTTQNMMLVYDGTTWQSFAGGSIASDVGFTPGGNLSATNVQAALIELDTEKVAKAGDTMTGPLLTVAPTLATHAANKGYVDTQDAAQNTVINGKADKTYVDSQDAALSAAIGLKADKTYVDTQDAALAAGLTTTNSNLTTLTGRVTSVEGVNTAQDAAIATKIGDAPNDGKQYARKSLAWAEFSSPIPTDAPSDGKTYGRLNAGWTQIVGGATIADTAPPSPLPGQLWWESDTGALNVWYQDGSSNQWVQTNANGIPDAPVDGKPYLRQNNGWLEGYSKATGDAALAGKVDKAGDVMTGALQVRAAALGFTPYPASVTTSVLGANTRLFNGAYDLPGANLKAVIAGRVLEETFDTAVGHYLVRMSGSVAAGANAGTLTNVYGYDWASDNFTLYRNTLNFAVSGIVKVAGVSRVTFPPAGGIYVSQPDINNHGILAYSGAANAASNVYGVLGYGSGGAIVGALGAYIVGQGIWSLYGNSSAYLASGTWQASDGSLKAETGDLTPATALANIMAIPVKSYTPASPAAARMLIAGASEVMEPQCGWFAQDIEPFIPEAVRDMPVPPDDPIQSAAAGGADSLKAVNLYPLVAQLWAAVQALSAKIDALEAA